MQRAKETATDVAASAKAGMEKTKATLGGKAEKMTTSDPARKEMAERKKEERLYEAERQKEEMREAARRGGDYGRHTAGYSAEGPVEEEHPIGLTRGVVGSQYPAGVNTGSERTGVLDPDLERERETARDRDLDDRPAVQDPRVGGGARTGHGAGSTY